MPKHYNASISERILRLFKFKSGDALSNEIHSQIVPIVPIQPICNILKHNTLTNGTGVVIWTTPTDKDFYLVAAQLSTIKDVTATSTSSTLGVVVDGQLVVVLLSIVGLTATPQENCVSITLPYPLKIARGSTIVINHSTAIANASSKGSIIGYTEETLNTPL